MSGEPMVRRRDAAQATRDRFFGRRLRYGTDDCVRMAAFHVRKLGHKVRLPASGSYSSARAGIRAMKALGYENLAAAVDAHGFARIAPAAAAVGDLVMLPGDAGLHSITIAMGNGRVLGFHEDALGAAILEPVAFVAAWRIDPA